MPRGHVCISCCRTRRDSNTHRFSRFSSFSVKQFATVADHLCDNRGGTGGDVEVVEIGARTPDVRHVIRLGSTSSFTGASRGEDNRVDIRQSNDKVVVILVVTQGQPFWLKPFCSNNPIGAVCKTAWVELRILRVAFG